MLGGKKKKKKTNITNNITAVKSINLIIRNKKCTNECYFNAINVRKKYSDNSKHPLICDMS